MPPSVALVHDYLTQRGGAERVVLALTRAFPGAPLYTSLYEPATTFPEFAAIDVRPLPLRLREQTGLAAARLPEDERDTRTAVPPCQAAQNVELARPSDETVHYDTQARTRSLLTQARRSTPPREPVRTSRELPD